MKQTSFACCAGVLIYVLYAAVQCTTLQQETNYDVYDSYNWARARWFLLKRLNLAPAQSNNSSAGTFWPLFSAAAISDVPGGSNRWRLAQDTSGQNLWPFYALFIKIQQPLFAVQTLHLPGPASNCPECCLS